MTQSKYSPAVAACSEIALNFRSDEAVLGSLTIHIILPSGVPSKSSASTFGRATGPAPSPGDPTTRRRLKGGPARNRSPPRSRWPTRRYRRSCASAAMNAMLTRSIGDPGAGRRPDRPGAPPVSRAPLSVLRWKRRPRAQPLPTQPPPNLPSLRLRRRVVALRKRRYAGIRPTTQPGRPPPTSSVIPETCPTATALVLKLNRYMLVVLQRWLVNSV